MATNQASMRDWGLLDPAEAARPVVVSPHLDDAVLGCGAFLATHPGATVITVFTRGPEVSPDPPTSWDALAGFAAGDDVLGARKREDAAALAVVGATPVWLDHWEHQYLERPDWVGADAVVDSLEAAVRAARPTMVLVPFGLANPDHDVTHEAALAVRDRMPEVPWLCYEDTGYKHIPGMLAWRISQLFRRGLWPTPVAIPIEAGRAAKDEAVACYRSQLLALEADWHLGPKLEASPEQCWRLAPPPPGWERLSAE
jgi:LmbE family N-acetylglucosaminyl deacetylase